MKQINLICDDEFEDVDILLVPDTIAENVPEVQREFNRWLMNPQNAERFSREENGRQSLCIDTDEILWWLNHVKLTGEEKASIVMQHTSYHPEYSSFEM